MLVRQLISTVRTIHVIRVAAGLCLAIASLQGVAAEDAAALLARAREAVGGNAWRQVKTQHTQFVRTYLDQDEGMRCA